MAGLFGDAPLLLRAAQHVLESYVLLLQELPCPIDDLRGEAQTAADLEGIGLAGDADIESVGGTEPIHIEFHGGVLHPIPGQGEGLDLAVVSGGHGPAALGLEPLQDGLGESRALQGVRARAQLVKKDQRVLVRLLDDGHQVGHMGAEGGQALLDGLLVADVRKDLIEDGYLAPFLRRQEQAAHGHEGKETHGLQCHRLAAGIGAGDDEGVEVLPEPQGDGHHLLPVDQGMTGVHQFQTALLVELGPDAALLPSQDGLGEDAVETPQQQEAVVQLVRIGLQQGGQPRQYALDLLLLVQQKLLILVPQLHHRRRLDEQGLARAALVMDEARDLPPMLRLHRDGVAAVAHGDDGILQILLIPGAADDAVELVPHLLRGDLHLPPDASQLRGCAVRHLLLGEDAAGDLVLDGRLSREPIGHQAQQPVASLLLAAQDRFPGPAGHL